MCPDCGRQFPTIVCYAGNEIKHSDEKIFLCMECGKNLKEKKVTFPHEEACW
jgi:DNA-directed RNA polymerase subunit RPC12/RpoP